ILRDPLRKLPPYLRKYRWEVRVIGLFCLLITNSMTMKFNPMLSSAIFAALAVAGGCSSSQKSDQAVHDATSQPAKVEMLARDFVFGDDRPFPQCHASTVLRTNDGRFLVAWFGGTHEKHDDVGIWLSQGEPGNWSAPVEVAKIREDAHW